MDAVEQRLSDDALVRVIGCDPGLPATDAAHIANALDKLGAQFVREGRCQRFAADWHPSGQLLVIAWEGPPLSGCSHDKIAQVVAHAEQRHGVRMLDAPPLAIGTADALRLVDRAGARALAQRGEIDASTPCWPRTATTLGAWRQGPQPLQATPFATVLRS